VRPHDLGQIHGWGLTRFGTPYLGTQQLLARVMELWAFILQTPLPGAAHRQFYTLPFPDIQQTNVYFGCSYAPMARGRPKDHGPPPAVAKLLNKLSCADSGSCDLCSKGHHTRCPWCPLHKDPTDKSLTCLIITQPSRVRVHECVYFCLSGEAFAVKQGSMFLFDGSVQEHGVWCPYDNMEGGSSWWAAAFVVKRPENR